MTLPLAGHFVVETHASPDRVARIRRIVAAHLRHWKVEPHITPVCAGVTELLGHVHRLGGDNSCLLELRWTGRRLTVSVEDSGRQLPRLPATAGAGFARVAALSDSWGACATPRGKVIWFTRSVATPQRLLRTAGTPLTGADTACTPHHPGPPPPPFRAPAGAAEAIPTGARKDGGPL